MGKIFYNNIKDRFFKGDIDVRKCLMFLLVLLFTACAGTPVKAPTYDTATLLFYSVDHLTITGKFINVPKEIPANFTKLPYNEIFRWGRDRCEIRFAESKDSPNFDSVFVSCDYSEVIALAKVQGVDKPTLLWIYDDNGTPIRVSYEKFKEALDLPEDLQEKLDIHK